MYIAAGQGQTTPGDTILMSTETTCHFGYLVQVSKKSPWSLILYTFFHDFKHLYSPGAGADNPLEMKFCCQQEHLVTSVICCKLTLWSRILYNIFHDFIHVYSPRAGTDSPQGTTFWCLVISFICHKFKPEDHWSCIAHLIAEDMLKSAVIEDRHLNIAPGQGQTTH